MHDRRVRLMAVVQRFTQLAAEFAHGTRRHTVGKVIQHLERVSRHELEDEHRFGGLGARCRRVAPPKGRKEAYDIRVAKSAADFELAVRAASHVLGGFLVILIGIDRLEPLHRALSVGPLVRHDENVAVRTLAQLPTDLPVVQVPRVEVLLALRQGWRLLLRCRGRLLLPPIDLVLLACAYFANLLLHGHALLRFLSAPTLYLNLVFLRLVLVFVVFVLILVLLVIFALCFRGLRGLRGLGGKALRTRRVLHREPDFLGFRSRGCSGFRRLIL
mmetsp:Transcript_44863/g.122754  ORF Transcript_44863/g.122754 Transcript_44863/m.122754 type:complete len:273 (-) Transcript_44863:667-1485(-)